jgi:hypothetical protein
LRPLHTTHCEGVWTCGSISLWHGLPKMAGGLVSRHETRWLAAHQSDRCGFLGPLSKTPIQV